MNKAYLPPNDVPASQLFLKLMETPKPSMVVDFPRLDHVTNKPIAQVRIQVLGHEQHDFARQRAHAALKAKNYTLEDLDSPALNEITGDAVARELLAMAVFEVNPIPGENPDKPGPSYMRVFRDAADLTKALTADELSTLFAYYAQVQYKYGPLDKFMDSGDEVDAWVKRLAEGAGEHSFLRLSSPRQVDLLSSLAARISGIYSLLASHSASLPTSLRSALESFSTDIFSAGEQPASLESIGSESSPDEGVSLQQAMRLAESIRGD